MRLIKKEMAGSVTIEVKLVDKPSKSHCSMCGKPDTSTARTLKDVDITASDHTVTRQRADAIKQELASLFVPKTWCRKSECEQRSLNNIKSKLKSAGYEYSNGDVDLIPSDQLRAVLLN